MKELWVGVVEVLTETGVEDDNTRAFTNVVTWSGNEADYIHSVTAVFEKYSRTVLGTENERPVAGLTDLSKEITEIIERAKTNPNACIFATFHYDPSRPC
jgi:hypothetical protein